MIKYVDREVEVEVPVEVVKQVAYPVEKIVEVPVEVIKARHSQNLWPRLVLWPRLPLGLGLLQQLRLR